MSEVAELLGQAVELSNMEKEPAAETEMVAEGAGSDVATDGEQVEMTNDQPNKEETGEPAAQEEAAIPQPDYLNFVKQEFGEEYDVDTLKAHVAKAKDYDDLLKQKQELESSYVKPANDYVKTLNSLIEKGASKDQLNSFIRLNSYGDVNEMSPVDIKVAKMVLIDNYSEDVARAKVERDYDLEQYDEGSIDRRILEDEIRVSAKSDLEALNKYRAELSTFENPAAAEAEKQALEEKALLTQHQAQLKADLPKVIEKFAPVKELEFGIKGIEDKVSIKIDYDEDFKAKLPSILTPTFENKIAPIDQNTAELIARSVYLEQNIEKIAQNIWDQAVSFVSEHKDNEYVNSVGLKEPSKNPETSNDKNEVYDFLSRLASGKAN